MIGRDGWAGLVILAFCAVLWWMTLGLKENPLVPIGPGFYPRIVVGITAFFAVLVVIGDLLARRAGGVGEGGAAVAKAAEAPNYVLVLASFAVFGAYVLALPGLGFRVATFLYVAVAAVLLARPRDAKTWIKILALALVTAAVTYFVFERYLLVLLPRGRWTGF
jgi:putative tricarboxylic transport membrane protein